MIDFKKVMAINVNYRDWECRGAVLEYAHSLGAAVWRSDKTGAVTTDEMLKATITRDVNRMIDDEKKRRLERKLTRMVTHKTPGAELISQETCATALMVLSGDLEPFPTVCTVDGDVVIQWKKRGIHLVGTVTGKKVHWAVFDMEEI